VSVTVSRGSIYPEVVWIELICCQTVDQLPVGSLALINVGSSKSCGVS